MSDQIQLIYNGKILITINDEISICLNGYWVTNSSNSLSGNFTLFEPGVYTVKAVDYFNQTVLQYFTITWIFEYFP